MKRSLKNNDQNMSDNYNNISSSDSDSDNSYLNRLKSKLTFDRSFWLINMICLCMYGCFYSFNNNAIDFLNTTYGYNSIESG